MAESLTRRDAKYVLVVKVTENERHLEKETEQALKDAE